MSTVDPFADIQAGSLSGFDYEPEAPSTVPGDSTPLGEESPIGVEPMTDEQAAAMVQQGSLAGEGEELSDEEAELDALMLAALEEPQESQPTLVLDDTVPLMEAHGVAAPDGPASAEPRRRPRAQQTRRQEKTLSSYFFMLEGVLDNGDPFWYIAHKGDGRNPRHAMQRLWTALGSPADGISFIPVLADTFIMRTLGVETVEREPIQKVVIR